MPEQTPFRLVIADDSEPYRNVMRQVLRLPRAPFEIVGVAGNGQEAIELVALHRPDGVVLDVSMPVLDGASAGRRLRALYPELVIVIVSSLAAGAAVQSLAGELGAAIVSKPYNDAKLRGGVLAAFAGR